MLKFFSVDAQGKIQSIQEKKKVKHNQEKTSIEKKVSIHFFPCLSCNIFFPKVEVHPEF